MVPGAQAFYLYDTLGFPVDLTQIMANEQGLSVDVAGFQAMMGEQKERSRVATRAKRLAGRTALALGAEQTAYLAKVRPAPTLPLPSAQSSFSPALVLPLLTPPPRGRHVSAGRRRGAHR